MPEHLISFAQNAEDVVLWRLFRGRSSPGFFVDVGAAHPVSDSVTKWFSLHDWIGINIEPVPSLFEILAADRPLDVNLRTACGAEAGTTTMTVASPNKWGQSSLDPTAIERLERSGWAASTEQVNVVTLSSVLAELAPAGGVDFLKIDVEGAEREVIQGADLHQHRPRVIVVEAVEPDSSLPNHSGWEPLVVEAGYVCVLFDGLNRFYCEADDAEARELLAFPAYCGDEFITYREYVLRMCIENMAELLEGCAGELEAANRFVLDHRMRMS